ncbi:MAG: hypothetical protein FJX74_06350 [Armatimonadetes bacterium]|nr:hypothetical protein [Armatimonadota bacterium]
MSDSLERPTAQPFDFGIPLDNPRIRRLLWLGGISIASLLLGPRLLAPLAFGWQRAERILDVDADVGYLQGRHLELQEEIEYRKTPEGQALTAADVLVVTYPHGRVVELAPRPASAQAVPPQTFGQRVKGWREKGRNTLHRNWRVLHVLLLDRRPPDAQSL